MFDLENDPAEQRNLIRLKEAPQGTLDELRQVCLRHAEERGPEGYVKGGEFVSLPATRYAPEMASKFPLWANTQWPHWGDLGGEREREIYLGELRWAAADEPTVPALDKVFDNEVWKERWKRRWMELGGDEATYRKLFQPGA